MGRSATRTAKSKPKNSELQPPLAHLRHAKLARRAPLPPSSLPTKKSSRRPQATLKYQDSLPSSSLSTASSDDAPPESPSSHRKQQQLQQLPPQSPPTAPPQRMQPKQEAASSRPKRRATNAHFIRFLQTRDPTTQEKVDLKRALQLSLMEYLVETEDSGSCSSSDQSNPSSGSSSNNSSTGGGRLDKASKKNSKNKQLSMRRTKAPTKNKLTNATNTNGRKARQPTPVRRGSKSSSQKTHQFSGICNCQQQQHNSLNQNGLPTTRVCSANTHCCPMSSVHNRYKPVTEKNIYSESDFFHEGIMEYIEYELLK